MPEFLVHSLSLFEFDRDSATNFHGVLTATELDASPGAHDICQRLVTKLWGKKLNTNTYVLPFRHSVTDWDTRTALTELATGEGVERAAQHLAASLSESGHSYRYALVLVGFTYKTTKFAAVILTKSATDGTFAVPDSTQDANGSELLRQLRNIYYLQEIDKGLLYPFYDSDEETADDNKARVFQHGTFADYFPKRLGLEVKPSPSRLVATVLPQAIVLADKWPGADQFSANLIAMAQDMNVEDVKPEEARVLVRVDNAELHLKLKELTTGKIRFARRDNIYSLTITGHHYEGRIGNEPLPFDVLDGGEDE